jgi:hypothetical protein
MGMCSPPFTKGERRRGNSGPVIINATGKGKDKAGFPSRERCHAGEMHLLKLAQKGSAIKGAIMLATCLLTEEDLLGTQAKVDNRRFEGSK